MTKPSFGHFDSTGRAYTITDHRTPMPWVNVICNGRFGLVVSQNGGGFSWYDNSQLNVLTRWDMDMVRDEAGKHLFVADLESQDVWSVAPAPRRAHFDRYSCTHGLGFTTFRTERKGIAAEWTLSVAPKDAVEVWRVRLTNVGTTRRKLRVSSNFEWCCGAAPDTKREFHRLFLTTKYDASRKAIIAHKNMWDIPARNDLPATEKEKLHWNAPWPYVAAHAVAIENAEKSASFKQDLAIADKSSFLGRYAPSGRPEAMLAEKLPSPSDPRNFGRFGDASASLGGDIELAPGSTTTLVYTIAIASDEASVLALIDRFTNVSAVDKAIEGAGALWESITEPSQVRSAMPDFDNLNNAWLPYQAISARIWGRTGYYQQSGAYGFRDQLQDSHIWLPRDPKRTREQILLHAAHQFVDGSVYHWWHPLAEFGLRTACSDDYLWLAYLTCNYIKDTGDWGILSERAGFVDEPGGPGHSILEHCQRSIAKSLKRVSPRGLPLIGACDWNDGLSSMGVDGKGESVWLAQWLSVVLADFAHVLTHAPAGMTNPSLASEYLAARTRYAAAVNQHAWDAESGGQWYRAATRDDGRWIGTASNAEGKIFLNTQTWAILSETAPAAREDACWESVKEHLIRPMGAVLSSPAYSVPDSSIGYITRYAPGLRENGGVYMHAATWALMAACKRRDVASVEQIWRGISPPLRGGADAEAYVAEPYVMPGNVDGPDSATPGKAGWTWYTGSAAWLNRVSLEWILGIRATWGGLLIDPCPFASLGEVEATRLWQGRKVRVRFDARAYTPGMPVTLVANGRTLDGAVIVAKEFASGAEIVVDVRWIAPVSKLGVRTGNAAAAAMP